MIARLTIAEPDFPILVLNIFDVRKELDEYQRSLQFTQSQLADACEVIDELKCKVQTSDDHTRKLSSKLKKLEIENKKLHERVVQQEAYSRGENIIIDGMTETENESCV